MRKNVFFLFAAMVLLAGCAKEIQESAIVSEDNTVQTYINVGISSDTKTYMGTAAEGVRKVYWSNDDRIAVNGTPSNALSGLEANTATATFSVTGSIEAPYSVLYPSDIYADATHVNLPAVQTWKSDGFADGFFPMAGYTADGSSVTMSHLCAVVRVAVKRAPGDGADTDNLVSVRFKGRNDEQVSGNIAITYTPSVTLAAETGANDAEKQVKVVHTYTTSADAVYYYIVVPARTYSSGFDIIVQDASGDIQTKSKTSSVTLEAGKQYDLTAFAFDPSGVADPTLTIGSVAELIAFATDYNNKVYAGQDDLIVALSGDIAFNASTSADFNATGGIGQKNGVGGATADNYFLGVFDGGSHTISGLEATVPLFAFTDSGSQIKDLTLSSTCSLTVDSPAVDSNHGALVGRNKGLIKNCTSNANVTINNIEDLSTADQHYGGLVGRNYGGTIDGCSVTGNITCDQTEAVTSSNNVFIGGIAGTQASAGSITDSDYTGNITFSDGTTYGGIAITYKNDKDVTCGSYVYVGGILGYADNGVISGCNVATALSPTAMDVRGTFVPALGGIAGWVKLSASTEISDCKNYMSLTFASSGARAETSPCRVGGIAARSAADISGCNNYAAIHTTCNSTSIYLAGIVADGANVSNCNNESGGTITRTSQLVNAQGNRYIYLGGIMATNNASGDIETCINRAAILNETHGTSTSTTVDVGGILGYGQNQVDISGCENRGNVTAQVNTSSGAYKTAISRITMGGILGYGSIANTTISSSDNYNQIYCQYNSSATADNRRSYIGGIAGLMALHTPANPEKDIELSVTGLTGLEIDDCDNTGAVWSRNYNNTLSDLLNSSFGGGIVGAIVGTSESKAYVHDCTSDTGTTTNYRGICGGIAGYAGCSRLVDNTASQTITANANAEANAGIVGMSVGSSIEGCIFSGTVNTAKNIGGIAYKMDGTSSLNTCKVNEATITKGTHASATDAAVLVSNAASGATITDCGVKGTINNGSAETITLSSNMITTDGGATVSGTYIIP